MSFTVIVLERGRLGYITLAARDMGEAIRKVQRGGEHFQHDAHRESARFHGRIVLDCWAEARAWTA